MAWSGETGSQARLDQDWVDSGEKNKQCLGWLNTVYNFRGIDQNLETEIRWYSDNR